LTGRKLLNGATQADAATPLEGQFLVPATPSIQKRFAAMKQTVSRSERESITDSPSIAVDTLPTRTNATWGITGPELERLSGALRFASLHCKRPQCRLWLLTTNRDALRSLIADISKRITRLQATYRLHSYSVTTFESRGGLHAHIVFIGTREIAQRLRASKQFGDLIDVRRITDHNGLARKYLAKERTPQAGYNRSHLLGGRIAGSHQLPGGGDRVRLSRELERDAIEAGYVEAWQHTNAKRSVEEKPDRPCPCSSRRERHRPSGRR
jgi:hypothetical protein